MKFGGIGQTNGHLHGPRTSLCLLGGRLVKISIINFEMIKQCCFDQGANMKTRGPLHVVAESSILLFIYLISEKQKQMPH